jgi:hypothetical protein
MSEGSEVGMHLGGVVVDDQQLQAGVNKKSKHNIKAVA